MGRLKAKNKERVGTTKKGRVALRGLPPAVKVLRFCYDARALSIVSMTRVLFA